MTEQLTDLGSEQIGAEEREKVERGANALEKMLSERTDAEAVILDAVGRNMDQAPDTDTLTESLERLRTVVNEDAGYLIVWSFASNHEERLAWIDQQGGGSAAAFLRRLGALYGPELRRAYTMWRELPDNWSNFYREVFYDFVTTEHKVRIRIRKYSGEETVFEGPPDSMLDLATHMLHTLNYFGTKDVFRNDLIEAFLPAADLFVEKLRTETEAAPLPSA